VSQSCCTRCLTRCCTRCCTRRSESSTLLWKPPATASTHGCCIRYALHCVWYAESSSCARQGAAKLWGLGVHFLLYIYLKGVLSRTPVVACTTERVWNCYSTQGATTHGCLVVQISCRQSAAKYCARVRTETPCIHVYMCVYIYI